MKKTILISVLLSLFLGGCASSGYKDFYKPLATKEQLNKAKQNPNLVFLKNNEEPKIYTSQNLQKDDITLQSRGYRLIGYSSFNGGWEKETSIIEQAKRIGAVLAIYKSDYTNTQTNSGALVLPKTNYHSGTVYGSNGGYASFSGTSTGTTVVPYSNTQRRYDQTAWFYIYDKSIKKLKFGIGTNDIPRKKRIEINTTGVYVKIIFEGTPVYNSNLLMGDIIIKMNGIKIKNNEQILKMMQEFDTSNKCIFTVLRNGQEKDIEISF